MTVGSNGRGTQTNLNDVIILELLVDGNSLGESDCVSEVFVGELVHLDSVVWSLSDRSGVGVG